MHGNTEKSSLGLKTRNFDNILGVSNHCTNIYLYVLNHK